MIGVEMVEVVVCGTGREAGWGGHCDWQVGTRLGRP